MFNGMRTAFASFHHTLNDEQNVNLNDLASLNQTPPFPGENSAIVQESPEFSIAASRQFDGPSYDSLLRFYSKWAGHVMTCACCKNCDVELVGMSNENSNKEINASIQDEEYFVAYSGPHTLFLVYILFYFIQNYISFYSLAKNYEKDEFKK